MLIRNLHLQNFRNYEELELDFHPEMNIFLGENAQGKSNILEAVSYLSLTFSFRDAEDKEMIGWGRNNFFIAGNIENNSGEKEITAAYSIEKKKLWTVDGVQKHRYNDIFGNFYTVTFSPEDLALIKRGAEIHRRFLNHEMLQLYPEYCVLLTRFNKVLKQRNALLKEECSKEILEPWTEQFCELAAKISKRRFLFIEELKKFFFEAQLVLSADKEKADLLYKSFFDRENIEKLSDEELKLLLKRYLDENFIQEKLRKSTLTGPQRDNLIFMLNGHEAKGFASQGQQRSLVLSLKLAQQKLAEHILGETPVLLLDDVLSELDEFRAERVLKLMSEHAQTFITGTDNNFKIKSCKSFRVENGTVRELDSKEGE